MKLAVGSEDPKDIGHVLIIPVDPPRVTNARSVDEPDPGSADVDDIYRCLLSGRAAFCPISLSLAGPNLDVLLNESSSTVRLVLQLRREGARNDPSQGLGFQRIIQCIMSEIVDEGIDPS